MLLVVPRGLPPTQQQKRSTGVVRRSAVPTGCCKRELRATHQNCFAQPGRTVLPEELQFGAPEPAPPLCAQAGGSHGHYDDPKTPLHYDATTKHQRETRLPTTGCAAEKRQVTTATAAKEKWRPVLPLNCTPAPQISRAAFLLRRPQCRCVRGRMVADSRLSLLGCYAESRIRPCVDMLGHETPILGDIHLSRR